MSSEREQTGTGHEMGIVPFGGRGIVLPNRLPANIEPSAALAAGFNAEANFLAATQEAAALGHFDARARGYLTIAQGKLLVGRDATDEIRLSLTHTRDYREAVESFFTTPKNPDRTSSSYTTDARQVTDLLLGISEVVIRSGHPADSVIQETRSYIQGYHYDLAPDVVRDNMNSHQRREWVDRKMGQIDDLARLTEVIIRHPGVSSLTPEELVQEIKGLVTDSTFIGVTTPKWNESRVGERAKALASLARLQVMTHDLKGAETTVAEINSLEIDKASNTEGYRGHDASRSVRQSKIEGLSISAALQAKVASELNLQELTADQIEAVINSGDPNAIKALGYHGLVDAAETLDREDIPEASKDLILQGIDNKLADEEQKIKAQRELLAARRKALG